MKRLNDSDEAGIRRVLSLQPEGYLLKTVSEADLTGKVEEFLSGNN